MDSPRSEQHIPKQYVEFAGPWTDAQIDALRKELSKLPPQVVLYSPESYGKLPFELVD